MEKTKSTSLLCVCGRLAALRIHLPDLTVVRSASCPQLPFALIPILTFTSMPALMGDFANGR